MASGSLTELRGDDLSEATLVRQHRSPMNQMTHALLIFQHLYFKDPTFVEYFNAFLLLPVSPSASAHYYKVIFLTPTRLFHSSQAFSSRLFFNGDTGLFEQVHGEAVQAWSGEGRATTSTSLATLYLTDEVVGPVSCIYFDAFIFPCFCCWKASREMGARQGPRHL